MDLSDYYEVKNLKTQLKFCGDYTKLKEYGLWSKRAKRFLNYSNGMMELPKALREHYGFKTISVTKVMIAIINDRPLMPNGESVNDYFVFCEKSNTLRNWYNKEIVSYHVYLPPKLQSITGQTSLARNILSYWVFSGKLVGKNEIRCGPNGFYEIEKGKSAAYFNGQRRDEIYPGVYRESSNWKVLVGGTYFGTFKDYDSAVDVAREEREKKYGILQSSDHINGSYNMSDLPEVKALVERGKRKVYRKRKEGFKGVLRSKIPTG